MSKTRSATKAHLKSLQDLKTYLQSNDKFGEQEQLAIKILERSLNEISLSLESSYQINLEMDIKNDHDIQHLPAPVEIAEFPDALALYSDGGCRGNPGPGAYAYVIQNAHGDVLSEDADYQVLTTNNKMELLGALRGLQNITQLDADKSDSHSSPSKRVFVMTDSKYVVNGMKSWVSGWKRRGWRKADGKIPENLDLWKELDQVASHFLEVHWIWVKGHGGHPQNEYCDQKLNKLLDQKVI